MSELKRISAWGSRELIVLAFLILERLKKYCSHLERGFLGFGEALAKEQV